MLFFFFKTFQDRVSLCYSPGFPGTHSVDQAGLELRYPALCFPSAELKACATTFCLPCYFLRQGLTMYVVLAGLACTATSVLCLKAGVGACVLILEVGR